MYPTLLLALLRATADAVQVIARRLQGPAVTRALGGAGGWVLALSVAVDRLDRTLASTNDLELLVCPASARVPSLLVPPSFFHPPTLLHALRGDKTTTILIVPDIGYSACKCADGAGSLGASPSGNAPSWVHRAAAAASERGARGWCKHFPTLVTCVLAPLRAERVINTSSSNIVMIFRYMILIGE